MNTGKDIAWLKENAGEVVTGTYTGRDGSLMAFGADKNGTRVMDMSNGRKYQL